MKGEAGAGEETRPRLPHFIRRTEKVKFGVVDALLGEARVGRV